MTEYSEQAESITATVRTGVHTNTPNVGSVFGPDAVTIRLCGCYQRGPRIWYRSGSRSARVIFQVELQRIAD